MNQLVVGMTLVLIGVVCVIMLLPGLRGRRAQTGARDWGRALAERADALARRRGHRIAELVEISGTRAGLGNLVLAVAVAAIAAGALGVIGALSRPSIAAWTLPVLLPIIVLAGARLLLAHRVDTRRRRFAEQLDGALQLIASGLRAGHSLQRAVAAVGTDTSGPVAEEFTRVVNEHRLGRELGDALLACAERMRSDDLDWTAQAVTIHREVGGNLSEVLDHISDTIRERQQIRRQVETLSSEGRTSAVVLMVLPVAIALVLAVLSPGYLSMFVTTPIGLVLLVLCAVLFLVGGLWMRRVTRIRF